jgi:hypothetical protein
LQILPWSLQHQIGHGRWSQVDRGALEWFNCHFQILRYIVMFIVLAPYDREQSDLISRIALDKNLEKLPLYKYALCV